MMSLPFGPPPPNIIAPFATNSEQLLVVRTLEAVEFAGPVRDIGLYLVQVLQDIHGQYLLPEIPAVQLHAQNCLVYPLQPAQGEFGRQQVESHVTVQDRGTEPLKTGIKDLLVVKGEGTDARHRMPMQLMRLGLQLAVLYVHQRIVGNCHDAPRRMPLRLPESMHLFQVYVSQAGTV